MSGNLWEWCEDEVARDSSTQLRRGAIPGDDSERPLRGDSFDNPGTRMSFRVSVRLDRDSRHSNIGFRVVREDEARR